MSAWVTHKLFLSPDMIIVLTTHVKLCKDDGELRKLDILRKCGCL